MYVLGGGIAELFGGVHAPGALAAAAENDQSGCSNGCSRGQGACLLPAVAGVDVVLACLGSLPLLSMVAHDTAALSSCIGWCSILEVKGDCTCSALACVQHIESA